MKAFPTHREEGMDLRDYFAAKAVEGLINHYDFEKFRDDHTRIAMWSYEMADAMLKAREEK